MEYRRLGRAGVKVSALSFGSWVTYGNQMDTRLARECMAAAYDAGVNFFDNAEVYALGQSETIMGQVLKELKWPRIKYLVSTKFYWGLDKGPNERNTLNRKYLHHAIDASLKRLDLDFVDLVVLPSRRPATRRSRRRCGRCTTSSRAARRCTGARRRGRPPTSARPGTSPRSITCTSRSSSSPSTTCFNRKQVEVEYARLYEDIGLGLTTWSPLASGLLTGKYRERRAGGQPRDAAELRVPEGQPARREEERGRRAAGRRRGRTRLLARAARARVVREQSPRVDRHHRRVAPGTGRREHEGDGRRREDRCRRASSASTRSSERSLDGRREGGR